MHHIIMPQNPGDGMLFCLPAFGLREEREERRRTMDERCETVWPTGEPCGACRCLVPHE